MSGNAAVRTKSVLSASFYSRGRQSNRPLNKQIYNISNGNEEEGWNGIKRTRGPILNEGAGEGVSEKGVSEGSKGGNHQSGGRVLQGEGTTSAKAWRRESTWYV